MRKQLLFCLAILMTASVALNCPNSTCLLPVVPEPGVVATITSSVSGLPITGAQVTLSDNSSTYPMQEESPGVYSGANGTPGTFTLTARANGFQDAMSDNIVVTGEPCNVTTVQLQVQMNPV